MGIFRPLESHATAPQRRQGTRDRPLHNRAAPTTSSGFAWAAALRCLSRCRAAVRGGGAVSTSSARTRSPRQGHNTEQRRTSQVAESITYAPTSTAAPARLPNFDQLKQTFAEDGYCVFPGVVLTERLTRHHKRIAGRSNAPSAPARCSLAAADQRPPQLLPRRRRPVRLRCAREGAASST